MSVIDRVERRAARTNRRRLALGLAVFTLLVAGATMLPLEDWLAAARLAVDANPMQSRLWFIAAFVVATVAMVPGSLLMLCGGYLFGLVPALPLVVTGVTAGAFSAALFSRTLARDWLAGRFSGDSRFVAIDGAVAGRGFLIVMLSRLSLLMPFNLLNLLYGLTSIPLWKMTVATGLGMLPAVVLYTWLGSVAQDFRELMSGELQGGWTGFAIVSSGVAVAAVVTLVVHRTASAALKRELAERNRAMDDDDNSRTRQGS